MKIITLILAVLALSSCNSLNPTEREALFRLGLEAGQRVLDKATK